VQLAATVQVLTLTTVANGVPVVAKKLLGDGLAWPLDCGVTFFDRRPLLGRSKTLRGIALALVFTTACAPLIGIEPSIGAVIGASAMAGDLFSSFVKRRLAVAPSSRALELDQIPESLFPLVACRAALSLTVADIVLGVGVFFVGEIVLSRLLYRIHLRDQPY
jgi:hypothetical protein